LLKRKEIRFLLFIVGAIIFNNCSSAVLTEDFPQIDSAKGFSNPRYVEGELIVNIKNIHLFKEEELEQSNIENKIPKEEKPTLKLWSAKISNQMNQRDVENLEYTLPPTEIFADEENGNKILYWDLTDSLKEGSSIVVKRKFSYIAYDYKPIINQNIVIERWSEIPQSILAFYTKTEDFLIESDEIKKTAASIVGGEENPLLKANLIYTWIRDTMKYVYPPEKRGANEALKKCEGDCGQYSNLFIALARSQKIPARQQSGFNVTLEKTGYHVWSEIYLPPYGWVPVDATRENGFCFLDNKRLIASVGMNIPLRHTPEWAIYENSDVKNGVTDFMQLVTLVASGFDAEISTERKILRSENR